MATTQIIIPPFDFPIIERSSPIIASGIFNQLSHPNKGIIPITIPIKASMPKIRPIVCIVILNLFLTRMAFQLRPVF